MDFQYNIKKLVNEIKLFVKNICEGRDETHGYEHMNKVYKNSKIIFMETYKFNHINEICNSYQDLYILVITSALLHDVYDHKYDKDGNLKIKCNQFLNKYFSKNMIDDINIVIDNISFSKQNKSMLNGTFIGFDKLLTNNQFIVRNIVSDADKLEAIGKEGIIRCENYVKELYPNITENELKVKVINHINEKLIRLYREFIVTEIGLKMALPLQKEMLDYIEDYIN